MRPVCSFCSFILCYRVETVLCSNGSPGVASSCLAFLLSSLLLCVSVMERFLAPALSSAFRSTIPAVLSRQIFSSAARDVAVVSSPTSPKPHLSTVVSACRLHSFVKTARADCRGRAAAPPDRVGLACKPRGFSFARPSQYQSFCVIEDHRRCLSSSPKCLSGSPFRTSSSSELSSGSRMHLTLARPPPPVRFSSSVNIPKCGFFCNHIFSDCYWVRRKVLAFFQYNCACSSSFQSISSVRTFSKLRQRSRGGGSGKVIFSSVFLPRQSELSYL